MKARTKLQKRVVELSEKMFKTIYYPYSDSEDLPESSENGYYSYGLNDDQKKYSQEHLFQKIGTRLKSGKMSCLNCAHHWVDKNAENWTYNLGKIECPSCKEKLVIETTRKLKFEDDNYLTIVNCVEEFQVVRNFRIRVFYRVGELPRYYYIPVGEVWMIPNGKWECIGMGRGYGYANYGSFFGDYTLRHRDMIGAYTLNYGVYPKKQIHKEYKKRGFVNSFHNHQPIKVLRSLFNQKFETLWKAKQYELAMSIDAYGSFASKYWRVAKICMRNKYIVKDHTIYSDYIKMLEEFSIDIYNSKFACPEDLKKEHNIILYKKRERAAQIKAQSSAERKKKELKREEFLAKGYKNSRKKYFDLLFKSKNIEITTIKSPAQLKKESLILDHCAYNSKYHERPNSLMMTASAGDFVVETIEVCLEKIELLQVRGYNNKDSEYHAEIVKLMYKNMHRIRNIRFSKKVSKKKSNIKKELA